MTPIDIGSRHELFVDYTLIESLTDAYLHLHKPIRRERVFQVEDPLENACTACYNLIHLNDRILIYYRGYHPVSRDLPDGWHETQTGNLLTSKDGIHFERPSLGLIESEGSTDNNIFYRGYEAHNFCVFLDGNPNTPPEQRFKAVGGSGKNNLHGFVSADGIRWSRIQEGPLDITGAFDSINVPLWDPHAGCYRIFSRYLEEVNGERIRAIQSCTSDDFIHWTSPVPHKYDDGIPFEHFYTNATMPCPGAEHILLSFPMRFVPERTKNTDGMDYPGDGISDAVFMTSRDGVHWDRTFMEAWLRPGTDQRNWTHRNQTPAVGLIETAPDEWSMYAAAHYGWPTNALQRLTIRPHGFASVHAGYHGGELITKPFTFSGTTLHLNYATSAVGSIVVEIQDTEGNPIEGLTANDMPPIFGDHLDAPVTWRTNSNLSHLAGTPIRLRFTLKDADLFSLRFGNQ